MNIHPAQAIRDVLRGNDHNQLKLCHNILSMNLKKRERGKESALNLVRRESSILVPCLFLYKFGIIHLDSGPWFSHL